MMKKKIKNLFNMLFKPIPEIRSTYMRIEGKWCRATRVKINGKYINIKETRYGGSEG